MKIIAFVSIILSGCANIDDYSKMRTLFLQDKLNQGNSITLREHLDIEIEIKY